jgi:hypothetical protein
VWFAFTHAVAGRVVPDEQRLDDAGRVLLRASAMSMPRPSAALGGVTYAED